MFFENFEFVEMCQIEIEDNSGKIYSQFTDKVSYEIDFTAYGFNRDQPQVWELSLNLIKIK